MLNECHGSRPRISTETLLALLVKSRSCGILQGTLPWFSRQHRNPQQWRCRWFERTRERVNDSRKRVKLSRLCLPNARMRLYKIRPHDPSSATLIAVTNKHLPLTNPCQDRNARDRGQRDDDVSADLIREVVVVRLVVLVLLVAQDLQQLAIRDGRVCEVTDALLDRLSKRGNLWGLGSVLGSDKNEAQCLRF